MFEMNSVQVHYNNGIAILYLASHREFFVLLNSKDALFSKDILLFE